MLLASALAIPQRYYEPFARWLAARGMMVLTFDLRGMHASRDATGPRSVRRVQADFLCWARQDFSACVRYLQEVSGRAQISMVGHSLGAQHLLWADEPTRRAIARCVAVASGTGYWRDWAAPSRRFAPLLFFGLIPLLTPLWGYYPGGALRLVGDLPAGVARQWARWCRHPDFAIGVEGPALQVHCRALTVPISAYAFSDDEAITEHCVRQQLALTPHAPQRLTVLSPERYGVPRIGHIGALGRHAPEALRAELSAELMPCTDRPAL